MLFLLGIDSAFSFIEGFLTVLQDSKLFHDKKRYVLTLGLSVSAFLFSLIYATDAGLSFLDVIDVSDSPRACLAFPCDTVSHMYYYATYYAQYYVNFVSESLVLSRALSTFIWHCN